MQEADKVNADASVEAGEAEKEEKPDLEVVSEGKECMTVAEKLGDATPKDEEKGAEVVDQAKSDPEIIPLVASDEKDNVHLLDKSVHAAPEEEDMHALENSVDPAPEEEANGARVDQGKSEPKPNDAETLSNESSPKDAEETLAADAPAPDQETHDGGEAGSKDGFEGSYAGSELPQQRHVTHDATKLQPTASPVC